LEHHATGTDEPWNSESAIKIVWWI